VGVNTNLETTNMRYALNALVLLTATLLCVATPAMAKPTVGQPAPLFSGTDSNGTQHTLEQFRGRYVVLEWTNDGCPYVQKHYGTGNMQTLQKESTARDVVWLSIISSAEGKQGYADGARANGLTRDRDAAPSAVLLDPDGTIGRLYGAKTTPHMFIIDPQGTLLYMGGIDDIPTANWEDVDKANNHVRTALDEALAGKAVSNASTRPYGCSVKYGS
jgi:peroxiredoxin